VQKCEFRLLYLNEETTSLSQTRKDKAAEPSAASSSDDPRFLGFKTRAKESQNNLSSAWPAASVFLG
jgi:hypothetical protein